MEYASNAKANTGVALGAVGTGLGVLSGAGGLAGLLGIGPRNTPPPDPGDRPVTRYEMGLYKEISEKNDEIVLLKANKYTDDKDAVLQAQINQQAVWTAGATATMGFMNQPIQQLFSITKLGVPESSIIIPAAPATATPAATTNG